MGSSDDRDGAMNHIAFDIDAEEWETVAEVAGRLVPGESARVPGVVLHVSEGRRRWIVQTPWLQVRLDGGSSDEPTAPPVALPTRLVAQASELAAPVGSCRLEVGGLRATVCNEWGSASFGLVGGVHRARDPWSARRSRPTHPVAEVAVDQMAAALASARVLPAGVDLERRTPPDLWLSIDDGHVGVEVDWSRFGMPGVSIEVPALTTGQGASRVPHVEVADLLDALFVEGVVRLELDDARQLLWLDGPFWQAVVAVGWLPGAPTNAGVVSRSIARPRGGSSRPSGGTQPAGVPSLEGALALLDSTAADDGTTTVAVDGAVLRVRELTAPSGEAVAAAVAVRLVEGVEESLEVLSELNAFNATAVGLVGVRLWLDGGVVWAGTDVERARYGELDRTIRRLVRSTADLGPLVAMMGLSRESHVLPGQLSLTEGEED